MDLKQSVYHRARKFVRDAEYQQALANMNLAQTTDVPHEMLEMLRTTSHYTLPGSTLLDIGAHKGMFTKTAHEVLTLRRSICFEPNRDLHSTIQAQTKGFDNTIAGVALSDKEGEETFFRHADDSMNSTVEANPETLRSEFPWDNPDAITTSTVHTTTLDRFMHDERLDGESYLVKIDTQGNELEILRHGVETLERTTALIVEHMFLSPYRSTYGFNDLVSFLATLGFQGHGALSINKRPSGLVSAVDFLFSRQPS